MLAAGIVTLLDLPRLTETLCSGLTGLLNQDLYLVLDDLPLLDDSSSGLGLLGQFMDSAPHSLRFILASRLPVPSAALPSPAASLLLGTPYLAMDNEELVVHQTILQPNLYLWDLADLTARGEIDQGVTFSEQALGHPHNVTFPTCAAGSWPGGPISPPCGGTGAEALAAGQESMALRDLTGGPYFIMVNRIQVGAAFTLLGPGEEAERLLSRSKEIATRLGHNSFRKSSQGDDVELQASPEL